MPPNMHIYILSTPPTHKMKRTEAAVIQVVLLGLILCIIALDAVMLGLPPTRHNYYWPAPILVNIIIIFIIILRAGCKQQSRENLVM